MSIQPVGGIADLMPGLGVQGTTATQGASAAPGTFSLDVAGAVENLQALQSQSSALAVAAVTGDLDDVHDYTIASSQASVALELTAAIRNKAIDAFTEIMRMQA